MTAVLLAGFFGVLQGLRHALEPDHVTAVATMAVRERSARKVLQFAFAWGLGHALVLAAVGALLVSFRAVMPERLTLLFEIGVGAVLVFLGVRAFRSERAHESSHVDVRRPLLVGVVHGLAGTGAVTAIAVAGTPGRGAAMLALCLYATGAVVGMCLVAGAAGPLFARAARSPRLGHGLVSVAALASIGLGLVWSGKSLVALLSP